MDEAEWSLVTTLAGFGLVMAALIGVVAFIDRRVKEQVKTGKPSPFIAALCILGGIGGVLVSYWLYRQGIHDTLCLWALDPLLMFYGVSQLVRAARGVSDPAAPAAGDRAQQHRGGRP